VLESSSVPQSSSIFTHWLRTTHAVITVGNPLFVAHPVVVSVLGALVVRMMKRNNFDQEEETPV